MLPVAGQQALAQTDNYLRNLNVVREAVDDTAGAAQTVSKQQLQVSVGAERRVLGTGEWLVVLLLSACSSSSRRRWHLAKQSPDTLMTA